MTDTPNDGTTPPTTLTGPNTVGSLPNHMIDQGVSTDTDILQITDPEQIAGFTAHIADSINSQSTATATDLSGRIADIIIETTAQGASLLEVHIIDPTLSLLQTGLIGVTDDGFLWPPLEVSFPPDQPDRQWRLCQMRASKMQPDSSEANLILTFEDKIAAQLREVDGNPYGPAYTVEYVQGQSDPIVISDPSGGGVKMSRPGETIAQFVGRLVDSANKKLHSNISLVTLIDPNPQVDPNALPPVPTAQRPNPTKAPGAPTKAQQDQINGWSSTLAQVLGTNPGLKSQLTFKIADFEAAFLCNTPTSSFVDVPSG